MIMGLESDAVSTKVTEYFDRCLLRRGYVLNKKANKRIADIIAEIVANCSEHGDKKFPWFTYAFYNPRKSTDCGECHIVVVNLGETIFKGLGKIGSHSTLGKKLRDLTKKHVNYFFHNGYTKEALWTLYSLQQGVSKLSNEDASRGTGTITYIESFFDLGNHDDSFSQMSVNSGRASIFIDGKYKLHETFNSEGEPIKRLTFNKSNSFDDRPDLDYVRSLVNHFPGTLISIRILLTEKEVELNGI
jgi:hypothetical protein